MFKNFDPQFSLSGDEHDKLIVFDGESEEHHVIFSAGLNVELEVDMKAFGKRPLGRLVYHLYACLFAVCDEVAVWFASLEPLVFHYFLQNLETQLQQAVVQFFIIKVFGDDGEYGFYDFAADGVGVDEGND